MQKATIAGTKVGEIGGKITEGKNVAQRDWKIPRAAETAIKALTRFPTREDGSNRRSRERSPGSIKVKRD
jgi:hypothetical protein